MNENTQSNEPSLPNIDFAALCNATIETFMSALGSWFLYNCNSVRHVGATKDLKGERLTGRLLLSGFCWFLAKSPSTRLKHWEGKIGHLSHMPDSKSEVSALDHQCYQLSSATLPR